MHYKTWWEEEEEEEEEKKYIYIYLRFAMVMEHNFV
jgi:hypothetical protein